jgi:uncharacterized protein
VPIAESGLNNSHDWAEINFSITGNDTRRVNSKLDKVMNVADNLGLEMLADLQIDIIHI